MQAVWKLLVCIEGCPVAHHGDITLDVKGGGQTECRCLVVGALKVEPFMALTFIRSMTVFIVDSPTAKIPTAKELVGAASTKGHYLFHSKM